MGQLQLRLQMQPEGEPSEVSGMSGLHLKVTCMEDAGLSL